MDDSTCLKRIFALSGFGRLSRIYLLGSVNATICFPLLETVSITGAVMAMDLDDFWVSITGTVILIEVWEVLPPKIYPASWRNPLLSAVRISHSTSTSATIYPLYARIVYPSRFSTRVEFGSSIPRITRRVPRIQTMSATARMMRNVFTHSSYEYTEQ